MKIRYSIIIPTYKRKEHLVKLLDSLEGKIGEDTEIIVVEQVKNHKGEFISKAKELGFTLYHIYLDKASTPRAKNVGAKKAKGEYLIFFDDDVIVKTSPELFEKSFKSRIVAAVNGRSLAVGQIEESKRKDTGKITLLGKFTDGYSSKIPQEIETLIGCNMCWKRDVFLDLKGFDEQFTGNALREEADLSLRARDNAYKILFDPRVEVLHVRAESGGTRKTEGRIQWYFDFFSNETYFFLKHRPFWSVPLIIVTRVEWMLRCMFGFGREVSLRSLTTPCMGMWDGYKKYRRWKNENRS